MKISSENTQLNSKQHTKMEDQFFQKGFIHKRINIVRDGNKLAKESLKLGALSHFKWFTSN